MSYVDARAKVKFNWIMDANYLGGEEENGYSTFLRGWSTLLMNSITRVFHHFCVSFSCNKSCISLLSIV